MSKQNFMHLSIPNIGQREYDYVKRSIVKWLKESTKVLLIYLVAPN